MTASPPHQAMTTSPLELVPASQPEVAERHTVNAVLPLVEATLDELSRQWEVLASAVVPRPGVLHTDSILSLVRGFAATTGKLLRPRMAHWGWVAAGGLDHGRGHDDLIRIGAAGLCHSDLSVINGDRPRPVPMVLGHEAAGTVIEAGSAIRDLKPGDRVLFVVEDDGTARLRAVNKSISSLKGVLPPPKRKATLEEIEEAIGRGAVADALGHDWD